MMNTKKSYYHQIRRIWMKNKEMRTMLHNHETKDNKRYKKIERVACHAVYGGIGIGMVGFLVTISIDVIRTQPMIFGWLQKMGIICFLGIFLFSALLLNMIKEK